MCLMGGMKELGRRPTETSYVESWIFNSNKCFAVYRAVSRRHHARAAG